MTYYSSQGRTSPSITSVLNWSTKNPTSNKNLIVLDLVSLIYCLAIWRDTIFLWAKTLFFFFSFSDYFFLSNSYLFLISAFSILWISANSAFLISVNCFCWLLISLSSSSSRTSILASSSVFPHKTDKIGSTSTSKINSSLSWTSVFLSTPVLIGILLGVVYINNKLLLIILFITYWSVHPEQSLNCNFVAWSFISQFFYELISLNVNILSSSWSLWCSNVSGKEFFSCLSSLLLFHLCVVLFLVLEQVIRVSTCWNDHSSISWSSVHSLVKHDIWWHIFSKHNKKIRNLLFQCNVRRMACCKTTTFLVFIYIIKVR